MSANFAYTFIQHGWYKFDPDGFWSGAFIDRWGYGLYFMYFIGVLEFTGGIAILLPGISRYGALTLSVVMLGAVITRLIFGTSIDDVIYIVFSMVTMLYISIERGIGTDFQKLRSRI